MAKKKSSWTAGMNKAKPETGADGPNVGVYVNQSPPDTDPGQRFGIPPETWDELQKSVPKGKGTGS